HGLGDPPLGAAAVPRPGARPARDGERARHRLRRQALPLRLHHLRHHRALGRPLPRQVADGGRRQEALRPGPDPLAWLHSIPGMKIRIAHSPDSDDAFMFWALSQGVLATDGLEIEHVLADIETLNRAAFEGRYEVTAISVHAYAYLHDRYQLMPS